MKCNDNVQIISVINFRDINHVTLVKLANHLDPAARPARTPRCTVATGKRCKRYRGYP